MKSNSGAGDSSPKRKLSTAIDRRTFLRLLSFATMGSALGACAKLQGDKTPALIHVPEGQSVARFPEKEELILLTDRPPQLETPLYFFRQDLTPNEAFFVRWHLEGIPTSVDLSSFRLRVSGHVDNALSLSLDDLKHKFEKAEIVAVVQCSGNSRSFCEPKVPGGQWQNGAVGNARWAGVRLKDILAKAGLKAGAVEATFAGLDEAPLSNIPKFVKSLSIEQARHDDILVAYEMNGEPLPMLNGFPLRLVVPGWYATYWVKSLQEIAVLPNKFEGFWMEKAYRVPKNENAEESPEHLASQTVPISRMNVRSIFVRPEPGESIKSGRSFDLEGIAFDDGGGINKVELSLDNGISWKEANLVPENLGKYSFYRWRFPWQASRPGNYKLMVRATNASGQTQQAQAHWNKSGYMRNVIETLEVSVV